ncbi:MAG: hypothetical protein IMW89_19845, partial [Ktedonobacteraceae bacterium]|nr:hypothetical protein [Ktedonobacteraceae bacterium]
MAIAERSLIVGVFADLTDARLALEELYRAGFTKNEIGLITHQGTAKTVLTAETGAIAAI